MTREFRDRWCAALRSGEYKQAFGFLHTDAGYCCLGVACEVYKPGNWQALANPGVTTFAFGGIFTDLPSDDQLGEMGIPKRKILELTRMNDSGKYSFKQIADWIESNIPTDQQIA
jgi:hypothetical protein